MNRPQSPVSRTHDKLGVALMQLKLTGAIRGQRVIDVTASTPGYAAVLLELGAAELASLSVGPTPLSPQLKADPRVTLFEKAQLKNVPATALPGPFAFFTVDLRFVSARTSLRALAFRLVKNAHGVVWLKPEFEAAPEQVRTGAVHGEALIEHALSQFREKAASAGFDVVAEADARTPGSTTERIIHLLYRGR